VRNAAESEHFRVWKCAVIHPCKKAQAWWEGPRVELVKQALRSSLSQNPVKETQANADR
jgi:hypothetical protein